MDHHGIVKISPIKDSNRICFDRIVNQSITSDFHLSRIIEHLKISETGKKCGATKQKINVKGRRMEIVLLRHLPDHRVHGDTTALKGEGHTISISLTRSCYRLPELRNRGAKLHLPVERLNHT